MKRLLLTIPLVLLSLVNACGSGPTVSISAAQWGMVQQTLTAVAWTPTPIPTSNPNSANMVNWLNNDLLSTANSLESTMDAEYKVTNISFQNIPNSSALRFQVDVGCICMNNSDCCIPERTFVVIIESMKRNFITTLGQVPPGVSQMLVVCFDRKTKLQIGSIFASWQDVQSYLQGNLMGHQLGMRITRTTAP